jgi:DNA processing protein
VLAVPGSIRAEQHRGTNLLIRDGVRPYLGPEDLADVMSLLPLGRGGSSSLPADGLPGPLREFLDHLGGDPVHPDAIAAIFGLGVAETASRISALELAGEICSLPGGLILRCHRAP